MMRCAAQNVSAIKLKPVFFGLRLQHKAAVLTITPAHAPHGNSSAHAIEDDVAEGADEKQSGAPAQENPGPYRDFALDFSHFLLPSLTAPIYA